ncbi:MAG: ubiquitin-activating E1 FCCH domain-containing protein [Bacteroidales bacterium]
MTDKLLIANMETGLERDREPWLLPDKAFPTLEDAYLFRGRIKRRQGYRNLGRIVTNIGTASGSSFSGTLPNAPITAGTVRIQVGDILFYDDGSGNLLGSPTANTGTITYATGAITLNFSPALGGPTDVDLLNENPVMGLPNRELTTINEEQLIAFDTIKANRYSNANEKFIDITFHKTSNDVFSWTGSDSDFFWTWNYAEAFWSTNSINGFQSTPTTTVAGQGDGIRWYDGSGWVNFLPQVDGSNFLMGAQIIVSYRNRLVMLNTTEGTAFGAGTNFRQRARWSQNGTPYYVAPTPSGFSGGTDVDAWRDDQVGKGGFIDAPTSEQIISAAFIHDTLIVYFERSTWQLRYTGDPVLPFIWQRINVELGAESTFSVVPFDKGLIGVGNYGIVISNDSSVSRIDQKIPDLVFNIHNGNDGVKRVYGIRDFSKQLIYWTFPNDDTNPTYPTRVLIYDYLENTYAIFNDSITAFGTYQPFNDTTWADLQRSWISYPETWENAELQSQFPLIVAGNQQGFVFSEYNSGPIINDPSLFITNISQASEATVTSPNHNLLEGTIISINSVEGMTQVNGNIYRVSSPSTNTFIIQTLDDKGNFIDVDSSGFDPYTHNGFITVRNNISILTKKFNPYVNSGQMLRLLQGDYFLEFSSGLEFTTRVFLDENNNESVEQIVVLPETNVLQKVWYPAYYSSIGQFAQIEIAFSNSQMFDEAKSSGDVTIHAMMLYTDPSGRLTYGEKV